VTAAPQTELQTGLQTGLIVAVPASEPVVGRHRAALDPIAAWGIPAHITEFPLAGAA
jgi:hypothetical protein